MSEADKIESLNLEQKVNYYSGKLKQQSELLVGLADSMNKMSIENKKLTATCYASQMLIHLLLVNNTYREEIIETYRKAIANFPPEVSLSPEQLEEFERVLRMIEGQSPEKIFH